MGMDPLSYQGWLYIWGKWGNGLRLPNMIRPPNFKQQDLLFVEILIKPQIYIYIFKKGGSLANT